MIEAATLSAIKGIRHGFFTREGGFSSGLYSSLNTGLGSDDDRETVKRNRARFPRDFMFQLNREETKNWRAQIVTSNREKMGIRRCPYAFTENGVAMLSSVLNSERAIQVNIRIMRTFKKESSMTNLRDEQ